MQSKTEKGVLYIVATPIGNLEDMTLRAIRTLREADLIAAEDTRHTRKLLNAHGIETQLTSLFDRNEREKSDYVISRLNEGQSVAYVSDAGTPGVSDPGYILIGKAISAGIKVVPIPGASAAITALSASGLPMDSFVFYAFLPHAEGKKKNFFESLRNERRTMIFYDSPRRILATLHLMRDAFGGTRRIVVARELTKIHEEIIRGDIDQAIETLRDRDIKGEITVLLAGCGETRAPSEVDLVKRYHELRKNPSLSTRDIVNVLTDETGMSRRDIYEKIIQIK